MEKLIADPSATSQQATFADLLNATSSPASVVGRSPSDSQTGQTTGRSGLHLSRASLGAAAESGGAPLTKGISGRFSTSASASAALSAFLASKLKERLASVGSMEYKQTWKRKVTPAGRWYWAHTASARRTGDSGYSGPQEPAALATPNAMDSTRATPETDADKLARGANPGQSLLDQATLAGWPTASSRDWKDTPGMATTGINPDGSERSRTDMLPRVAAQVSGWATPAAQDQKWRATPNSNKLRRTKNKQLGLEAQAVENIGTDTNSSTSPTVAKGALNPALSRWLQGYPVAWCQAAIRAWRTLKRRPKRARCASKATATPSCPKSPPSL